MPTHIGRICITGTSIRLEGRAASQGVRAQEETMGNQHRGLMVRILLGPLGTLLPIFPGPAAAAQAEPSLSLVVTIALPDVQGSLGPILYDCAGFPGSAAVRQTARIRFVRPSRRHPGLRSSERVMRARSGNATGDRKTSSPE